MLAGMGNISNIAATLPTAEEENNTLIMSSMILETEGRAEPHSPTGFLDEESSIKSINGIGTAGGDAARGGNSSLMLNLSTPPNPQHTMAMVNVLGEINNDDALTYSLTNTFSTVESLKEEINNAL